MIGSYSAGNKCMFKMHSPYSMRWCWLWSGSVAKMLSTSSHSQTTTVINQPCWMMHKELHMLICPFAFQLLKLQNLANLVHCSAGQGTNCLSQKCHLGDQLEMENGLDSASDKQSEWKDEKQQEEKDMMHATCNSF